MEKCKFMSVFAPYMQKFVDAKEALGFSRKYFESVLGLLDRFFIEEKVRTPFITSVLIDKWGHTLINNSYKTICSKYSILAQFAKYTSNSKEQSQYVCTIHLHARTSAFHFYSV